MKIQYQIIAAGISSASDIVGFENKIEQALNAGWILAGGLAISGKQIMQAMVRPSEQAKGGAR